MVTAVADGRAVPRGGAWHDNVISAGTDAWTALDHQHGDVDHYLEAAKVLASAGWTFAGLTRRWINGAPNERVPDAIMEGVAGEPALAELAASADAARGKIQP